MNRANAAWLVWGILSTLAPWNPGVVVYGQSAVVERMAAPDGHLPFSEPIPPGNPAVRYRGGDVFWDPKCGGNCGPAGSMLDYHGLEHDTELSGEMCADACADPCCGPWNRFSAGVDFTFVKPHFESNPAFTILNSDGSRSDTFTQQELNFSTELAPRVWLEMLQCGSLGLRASWWQFDNAASRASASPPANGFGRIIPPTFGDVDLSTSIPNSTYSAGANLKAYNVDLEGTHSFQSGEWGWLATAGMRYASIEQGYTSRLTSATGVTQGSIDYFHEIRGIGPTMSLRTLRPFTPQLGLFGTARGSLLFGDSTSRLNAIEDQDLDTSLTTQSSTSRDDLLPVADVQVGLQYCPLCSGRLHPYMHFAMEGQVWGGAGNSSSETGSLGFYGFNFAFGFDW